MKEKFLKNLKKALQKHGNIWYTRKMIPAVKTAFLIQENALQEAWRMNLSGIITKKFFEEMKAKQSARMFSLDLPLEERKKNAYEWFRLYQENLLGNLPEETWKEARKDLIVPIERILEI